MMLDRLRSFLSGDAAPEAGSPDDLHLAVAVLLVHAGRADRDFAETERAAIRTMLAHRFELDGSAVEDLLAEAERTDSESVDLWTFARRIVESFGQEDRVRMIEMLWEVAYADGRLDDHEANLLRRIGGLIYVPDQERGRARKRVLERLGLGEGEGPA